MGFFSTEFSMKYWEYIGDIFESLGSNEITILIERTNLFFFKTKKNWIISQAERERGNWYENAKSRRFFN